MLLLSFLRFRLKEIIICALKDDILFRYSSVSLQLQLKMKGQGEIATKDFPNFAAGRGFPVKEILLKEAPSSAKLLLASGLLDGHYVRYLGRGGHVSTSLGTLGC